LEFLLELIAMPGLVHARATIALGSMMHGIVSVVTKFSRVKKRAHPFDG
jgi:hypothetical protein